MKKKKSVGIITLHRTTNYGSVLQAYALQETIKALGFDVKIIDYRPSRSTMPSMIKGLKNKKTILKKSLIVRTGVRAIMIPSYMLRFKTFNGFVDKYLDLTKKQYVNETEIEVDKPVFDIYCTGSDQVWNSEWNEKIDKPLFLSFAPDESRKISYAASFGKEKLDKWEVKETKELLDRYNSISVRELSGLDILKKLGIKNAKCVLDPTLLLNGAKWKELSSKRFSDEKYILVYNLNRNKTLHDYAIKLAERTGYKIKYITYQLHDFYKTGKMYCNTSVENYLALIANAKCIVTDSFHGVAFSINFNRDFVVICPKKFGSRLESILEITGLSYRIANGNNFDELTLPIGYDNVNRIIEKQRTGSIDYLRKALVGSI